MPKLHQRFNKLVDATIGKKWVSDDADRAKYVYEVHLYEPSYTPNQKTITVKTWDKALGVAIGWMMAHGIGQYLINREFDGAGSVWDWESSSQDSVGAQIFKQEVH